MNPRKLLGVRRGVRLSVRRADPDNPGASLPDGELVGAVEVYVDVDALVRYLGSRAIKSKGRKAILADGAIELIAKNVTHVSGGGRS